MDLVSEEKAFRDIFKQQSKHINEDHEEIANSVVDSMLVSVDTNCFYRELLLLIGKYNILYTESSRKNHSVELLA